MNPGTCIIREVTDDEDRARIFSFITRIALQRHNAHPPPLPEILLAAFLNDEPVGTIGMDFGSIRKPLPLEKNWRFSKKATPFPFDRERIAQYGRWTATQQGVSLALFYTLTVLAQTYGKRYCLCEAKDPILQRLVAMGMVPLPVMNARLLVGRIPQQGRPYYLDDPAPVLFMMDLDHVYSALRERLPSKRSLSFCFSASLSDEAR